MSSWTWYYFDTWNKANEAEYRQKWELEIDIRYLNIKHKPDGRKPKQKHTNATGTIERGRKKKGIDWIRYRKECLKLYYLPFLKGLGPGYVAQQDNAPSHSSQWNRTFLQEKGIDTDDWPPNSPDLSPIEPLWGWLKVKTTLQGVLTKANAQLRWSEMWPALDIKLIRRFYRRCWENLKWVIHLRGDNHFREGSPAPENWAEQLDWEDVEEDDKPYEDPEPETIEDSDCSSHSSSDSD